MERPGNIWKSSRYGADFTGCGTLYSYDPQQQSFVRTDQGNSPNELHHPDSPKTILPIRLQTVGQYVTVKDLIRYLDDHPEIVQKDKQIVAPLQRMIDRQSQILKTEEDIQSIERVLNETTLQLYDQLSESEKQQLRLHRNIDSVEGVEAEYWKTLLDNLESE